MDEDFDWRVDGVKFLERRGLKNLLFKNITMRIIKPSSYIKGYILFKKEGYVKVYAKGFVSVKSETNPDERPYIFRFSGDDWRKVKHSCGAKVTDSDSLCKHEVASIFAIFPNALLPPNEKIVEVFEKYRANYIPSSIFDKDAKGINLTDDVYADNLWLSLFSRLFTNKLVRLKKSAVKTPYENLISAEKYLTARLKTLISAEKEDDPIYRVLVECNGKNLNEIISKCEQEGVENAKAIIYRAFEEGLLLHKKIGEVYLKVYKHCSDLNLVL